MTKNCIRAEPFIATRNQHLSELAEDYVEIIADLIRLKGKAKTCDIAKQLGVSHVTVIRTLERLRQKNLLVADKGPITLTSEGKELADFCKARHLFLVEYLLALGVPEPIAIIDVEGLEHHVSPTTLKAFKKHLKSITPIK